MEWSRHPSPEVCLVLCELLDSLIPAHFQALAYNWSSGAPSILCILFLKYPWSLLVLPSLSLPLPLTIPSSWPHLCWLSSAPLLFLRWLHGLPHSTGSALDSHHPVAPWTSGALVTPHPSTPSTPLTPPMSSPLDLRCHPGSSAPSESPPLPAPPQSVRLLAPLSICSGRGL